MGVCHLLILLNVEPITFVGCYESVENHLDEFTTNETPDSNINTANGFNFES